MNLLTPSIIDLMTRLDKKAYLVGGCVRNFLLGQDISDIDMACEYSPDQIKEKLKDTSIQVIPTGIKFGTLTLILPDRIHVEITTFRSDQNCDGRYANVQFGQSMEADSARRDLSINAMYMDINGVIYDFQNGQRDLKKGKIKLIGNPQNRIREDFLRILRVFRFWSFYGKGKIEKNTLKACFENVDGLGKISKQRIKDELFKIFSSPKMPRVMRFLDRIFKWNSDEEKFRLFKQIKRFSNTAILVYFVLNRDMGLPLSRYEKKYLNALDHALQMPCHTHQDRQKIAFLYGRDVLRDILILNRKPQRMILEGARIKIPQFDISAKDLGADIPNSKETFAWLRQYWFEMGFVKKDVVLKAFLKYNQHQKGEK